MIRPVTKIDDLVPIRHVVISVSNKDKLDILINGLLSYCPGVKIYASGNTYKAINDLLPLSAANQLVEISQYTGQPETEGGLVKTLHHKLFLGYLTETYCEAHQRDLQREAAVSMDLVVINFYPFRKAIDDPSSTFETARGNIDIGGPSALRAAAKNCLRVMTLSDPEDYDGFVEILKGQQGQTTLSQRVVAATNSFRLTYSYDQAICLYLSTIKTFSEIIGCYQTGNPSDQLPE
ncbi:MAG: hypothetical protein WC453_02605 [Patescibacteria group bacterium]